MNRQHVDVFLTVTLVAVVIAGAIALVGWDQYETDRDNHRGTFITNDHVTNLHHELVKDD